MARHRKFQAESDADPALDISSLIDVCFLLLIYFITTSTIAPKETDLGMALPGVNPTPGEQSEIEPLFIRVSDVGAIFLGAGANEQAMDSDVNVRDLPQLNEHLTMYTSAAKAAGSKPLVQLWADGGASQQRVIDVMNALAGVNISSVTFTNLIDPP
jgi:biopolymer transport protein ExbD